MSARLWFIAVTTFWLVMNFLLWRAEYGAGRGGASQVSLDAVVERLLQAPDKSVLKLYHHNREIGVLHWTPSIIETPVASGATNAAVLEGMVTASGYNLELDLSLNGERPTDRWRIVGNLILGTNQAWQHLNVRVHQRPAMWELTAHAGEDEIALNYENGAERWTKRFSGRELANPASLLGPYRMLLPGQFASTLKQFDPETVSAGLQWEARHDQVRLGRSRVRVFRVSAKLFSNYEIVAQLSRAGEVLKVTLPDTFVLVNEALPVLRRQ